MECYNGINSSFWSHVFLAHNNIASCNNGLHNSSYCNVNYNVFSENEIGIHSIRGGTIVGEHSIIMSGNDEVIELKHEALSKNRKDHP